MDDRTLPAGLEPGLAATDTAALLDAARAVLKPLAHLAVARGVPYAALDELLKSAFVAAARDVHPRVPPHRAVSRISTATGLNRREVTRLVQPPSSPVPPRRSPATEVFTRWLSDPALRAESGLPRQGPPPSFESLAQSVTRDVHPRSLLEELCRLGLAELDESGERVHLLRSAFVPKGDQARMLAFLGANVGDHLSAAVANVLTDGRRHFEQALFADALSKDALEQAKGLISAQWQALLTEMAPALQQLIDDDRATGRAADQRLRIGMYAYSQHDPAASEDGAPPVSDPS